eukprot:scaffold45603_cov31-Tisochrysis_lutea.AAC.1
MHLCTQAEHLIARGHYAAARRLLHRAQTLARASDHPEAEARALLVEAMAQSAANDFSGAIMLIQQAQRIGGMPSGFIFLLPASSLPPVSGFCSCI